jgi:hypothetical protein
LRTGGPEAGSGANVSAASAFEVMSIANQTLGNQTLEHLCMESFLV